MGVQGSQGWVSCGRFLVDWPPLYPPTQPSNVRMRYREPIASICFGRMRSDTTTTRGATSSEEVHDASPS
eukprot:5457520-Pyramimonas_sp.AAC.1